MSRRAHLHELTQHLKRYLLWQKAMGVDGLVGADAGERQRFEERKRAVQRGEVEKLKAGLDVAAKRAVSAEASNRGRPDSAKREESGRRERIAEVTQESRGTKTARTKATANPEVVTADTPLWKKHDPIHELERRRHEKRKSARSNSSPVEDEPPVADEAAASAPPQDAPPVGELAGGGSGSARPETPAEKMDYLRDYLGDCRRCPLHQGRSQVVFGEGNPRARLVFIGEGPGGEEDKQGLPFVGPSGELLTKMIAGMGLSREEVYITNVVKCRPPKNRNPAPQEIRECSPFLKKQLEVLEPEVIVTLGRFAANVVLGVEDQALGGLRGRWHQAMGVAVMPTYHPAYILRNKGDRELKGKVWSDLKMVMRRLGLEQ